MIQASEAVPGRRYWRRGSTLAHYTLPATADQIVRRMRRQGGTTTQQSAILARLAKGELLFKRHLAGGASSYCAIPADYRLAETKPRRSV